MEASTGSIFRTYFDAYKVHYPQPLHKLKAVTCLQTCRTAARGGHVERCPEGHVTHVHYNSCKHRSCPQCNGLPGQRWLEKTEAKLLDCDHFHVVITLPHYLIILWWANPRLMADLLFKCATKTIRKLLADPKHLGAEVGMICTLHTWGRDLSRHPHLHCLVTGGGITENGDWKAVKNDYLLPYKVLRKCFRGCYVKALREAYKKGKLRLPRGLSETDLHKLIDKVASRVKWNTHICERYGHGKGVAIYLARYARGGPINNKQISINPEGQIVLRHKDHLTQRKKNTPLSTDEFMRRILWHIPEPRQHVARYYGLYHAKKSAIRASCRTKLGQAPEVAPPLLDCETYLEQLGVKIETHCNVCGARLVSELLIANQQAPPEEHQATKQAA